MSTIQTNTITDAAGTGAPDFPNGINAATALISRVNDTERMRIDSSGNVGIGTTSPTADLSVGSATTSSGDVHLRTTKTTFELTPSNSDAGGMDINVGFVAGGQGPLKFSTGNTERVRISSVGFLGIGTSNPAVAVHVSGGTTGAATIRTQASSGGAGQFQAQTDGSIFTMQAVSGGGLRFVQEDVAERARIDSSGNLLVGTTTGSDKLLVRGASARLTSDGLTSNATLTVQAHNGAGYDAQLYLECPGSFGGGMFAARSVSQIRVWCGNQAAGVSLANSAASWGSYSDERIKDIIEPITDAANKVSSLRAVIGKYKSDAPEKRRSFLIAQDVQAVLPEAVYQNSEEDDTLSLAYTDVIPLLVAAIQELKAEVDSLRAQLNP
jgi:hypothetical protein